MYPFSFIVVYFVCFLVLLKTDKIITALQAINYLMYFQAIYVLLDIF
jgi:hypothetical protein